MENDRKHHRNRWPRGVRKIYIGQAAGGLFGFLEGTVVVGILIYLAKKFPLSGRLANSINGSQALEWLEPVIEQAISHAPWLISKLIKIL